MATSFQHHCPRSAMPRDVSPCSEAFVITILTSQLQYRLHLSLRSGYPICTRKVQRQSADCQSWPFFVPNRPRCWAFAHWTSIGAFGSTSNLPLRAIVAHRLHHRCSMCTEYPDIDHLPCPSRTRWFRRDVSRWGDHTGHLGHEKGW